MMCNIIFVVEPHRQRHLIIHTHSYYFSWHNILDIADHEAISNNYATEWNIYTTKHKVTTYASYGLVNNFLPVIVLLIIKVRFHRKI